MILGTGHSSVTKVEEATPVETNGGNPDDAKSSSDSDADIEDNLEDPPRLADTRTPSVGTQAVPFTAYSESGYNSDKVISSDSIRTSPDLNKEKTDSTPETSEKDKLFIDNSTSTSAIPLEYKPLVVIDNQSNPDSGVASPETTKHNSTETVDNVDSPINGKELGSHSSLSSEINLDMASPQKTPEKNDFERPVSRIDFAPEYQYSNEVVSRGITAQGCKNVLECNGDANASLKAKNGEDEDKSDAALVQNFYNWMLTDPETKEKERKLNSSPVTVEPEMPTVNEPKTDIPEPPPFIDRVNHTYSRPSQLTSRYVCEEDECSIQSCLSQFTALELLTGNNKVGCETCTTRANGKDGKTVYTNATKRFLVSSPPAILILHLKRFQIGPRCMFRKMSKHVDFPTILDLAPFCAMDKVRKLPNATKHQNELIYSLYGVVEHSGGMHGGHYVAYVKVRPGVKPGDPRWWFLPKSGNTVPNPPTGGGDTENDTESDLSGYESGEGPLPMPSAPPGKWYYVSDSMVSEISEEKVLKAQAYLLFYERIF